MRFLLLLLFLCLSSRSVAFVVFRRAPTSRTTFPSLAMAPKYDKTTQLWSPGSPEEGPEGGYPPMKSLLLHGPNPFFRRIFQPEDYEQAVLKFMAEDKRSRLDAMGNMDAYFKNPNDWTYYRMEEERLGKRYNLYTINAQEIALAAVWTVFVLAFVGRVVYSVTTGVDFYAFGPFSGSK